MKNSPSIWQYAKSLGLILVLSLFLSLVFSAQSTVAGNPDVFYGYIPKFFVGLLALNLIVGFALKGAGLTPKGVFKNDSLVINDTTYAGMVAPQFVLPAMFNWDTYNKGMVYLKDGIKKKYTIPTMDFTHPLQPRIATPSGSGGNVEVGARTLEPKDIMAYQEMNPRNFEVHWDAENLSQTLLSRTLPQTAENYIMLLLLGRSFEQFEVMTWMGSTNYANNVAVPSSDDRYQIQFIDGFIKRFLADSSVYKVSNPLALTSSNIGTALNSLYNAVATYNKALLARPDKYSRMKFGVSILTATIYEEYLTTQPYKNNDTTDKGLNRWKGFDVVPLAGLPDNTIVFTEMLANTDGNLWIGMNSVSDENFMLARLLPNSELFFFKMLMKLDINYTRPEKVFLYTTLTSADFIAS